MQNLKQQRMVHQKEQMQETPSWVDLEHLKQMNTQCQKRLQKFQAQLLNQRMLVRKGRQSLNVYKVQMQNTGCYFLGGSLLYLPHLGKKKKKKLCLILLQHMDPNSGLGEPYVQHI